MPTRQIIGRNRGVSTHGSRVGGRGHPDGGSSCPISGRKLPLGGDGRHRFPRPADPDLVAHLVGTTGLTAAEAVRVVEDVVAFHAEPVEEVVRRRHAELKTYGAKNPE